ncbi:hypothetical protein OS493_031601 [Desmophyllum pertusum]|uniref:Granulins domain-containing protein n=1 Tax=Desmophyllum pertusum TaxID=174260 RepID=A0A9W9YMU7_9CNID|nr:hypothetical protein OS493_031601 [Desmophyllum pertusum]
MRSKCFSNPHLPYPGTKHEGARVLLARNLNEIGLANAVVCPDGEGQCPPDHSCCSVPDSDQVHCCPSGYSCEKGLCQETSVQFPAAVFSTTSAKIVKCNQKYACPDRYTVM